MNKEYDPPETHTNLPHTSWCGSVVLVVNCPLLSHRCTRTHANNRDATGHMRTDYNLLTSLLMVDDDVDLLSFRRKRWCKESFESSCSTLCNSRTAQMYDGLVYYKKLHFERRKNETMVVKSSSHVFRRAFKLTIYCRITYPYRAPESPSGRCSWSWPSHPTVTAPQQRNCRRLLDSLTMQSLV